MPRPGFVLEVDESTPPVTFPHGGGLRHERLPAGRSRVLYAPEPVLPRPDPGDDVRRALAEPLDGEALAERLRAGSRLTVVVDPARLPSRPGRRPDGRQLAVEAVLDLAATAGVDDVAIVIARGLERRPTDAELRAGLGLRVHDAFAPHEGLLHVDVTGGLTAAGDVAGAALRVDARVAASDLVVHVGVAGAEELGVGTWGTPVTDAATAAWLAVGAGVADHPALRTLGLTSAADLAAVAAALAAALPPVVRIATTATRPTSGALAHLAGRETEWSPLQRAASIGVGTLLGALPGRVAAPLLAAAAGGPPRVASVHVGSVEAVHAAVAERLRRQHVVAVDGPADVVTLGVGATGGTDEATALDPVRFRSNVLGHVLGLRTGEPLVRAGGVVVVTHPLARRFDPVRHPSAIDLYDEGLGTTTDAAELLAAHSDRLGDDEWFARLHAEGGAAHGAHALREWARATPALEHLGGGHHVVVVGGDPAVVRRLGFRPASTLGDALEMASEHVGRTPSVAHLHAPPDVVVEVG